MAASPEPPRDLMHAHENLGDEVAVIIRTATWSAGAEGALLGVLGALFLQLLGIGNVTGLQHDGLALTGAALAGLAFGVFRQTGWLVVADVLLAAAVCLIAFTPMMIRPMNRLVRSDPISRDTLDAVVVLSSGMQSDTALSADGADRLLRGLELVQRGVAPQLVTTRVLWKHGDKILWSDADQHRLVMLAGADRRWTAVGPVGSTRDEAVKSAQLLFLGGARRIAVVTSPSHTRRACETFEKIGFKVTCVPSIERDHVTWHPSTPADRLAAFRAYLYERLGMVEYRHNGWV